MTEKKGIEQFNSEMLALINDYVDKEDFNALATPLKSALQIKNEVREQLVKALSYESFAKGVDNAVQLIQSHLETITDPQLTEKYVEELNHGFKAIVEFYGNTSDDQKEDWMNRWNPEIPIWKEIFGVSDETLLMVYDIVLEQFNRNQIENAKDLLQLLLMFAPTLPSYWNALGFAYQKEGKLDHAVKQYLMAEELNPELLDCHFYLARCYMEMNKKCLAKEEVEKLSKLCASLNDEESMMQVEELALEIG